MRTTIFPVRLIGLYLANRIYVNAQVFTPNALLYSAVMWGKKQEDALLHCDSAINTITPPPSKWRKLFRKQAKLH